MRKAKNKKPAQNDQPESPVKWAFLARQFLSRQNKDFLQQAILETKKNNELEITDCLQAFANGKTGEVDRLTEQLIPELNQTGRREEALTLNLLVLHTRAVLVETYVRYTFNEQKKAKEVGIQSCQRAIQISQILKDKPCEATYAGKLANGFANSRQYTEAEYFNKQALQLYRDCARQEPRVFLKDVAMTLNNLGNAQSDQRKLVEAETSHTEALEIRKKLAKTEPDIFNQDVAMTLNNLGALHWEQKRLAEAETFYIEALEIYQRLAETETQAFLKSLAATLNNLGALYWEQRRLTEAETSFAEALEIRRKLAKTKPRVFLKSVAMTANNLGVVHRSQRRLTVAEVSFNESLKIYQKLAKTEPRVFNQDVAMTLNNLGNVQSDQGKLAETETSYAKALKIYQKLAETEPHIFNQDVAIALNNLGTLYWKQRKLGKAETFFAKALEIRRELAETEPHIFNQEVAVTLNNLGTVQGEQRKLAEAEVSFAEALEVIRKLAKAEPHIFTQDLAMTFNNIGNVQSDQRKLGEAETSYTKALEIYQRLATAEPHIFSQDVAMTLNNLGITQRDQKKAADAETSFAEALKIRRNLAKTEPYALLEDVAMTLNNLGIAQSDQRKLEEAETSYTEALEIRKKLAKTEPDIFNQDVAMTLNNLGALHWEQKRLADAEKSYVEALRIRRGLALREPHIFNQDVAITLNNLGTLRVEQDKLDEAKKNFESARVLIEGLRTKAITIDERSRILQENAAIYSGLLACHIKMENWKKALEIAELGKSRSLSDLLNLKSEDLQPKAPTSDSLAVVKDLGRKYSNTIKELQRLESDERYLSEQLRQSENVIKQIEDDKENDDPAQKESLRQIFEEKQLLELDKQKARNQRFAQQSKLKSVLDEIKNYDKDFPPKAKEIGNEEIIGIAKSVNRTIVIFRVLLQSTAIIFVFPDGSLQVETVPTFGQDELFRLFHDDWLIPYQNWKRNHKMPNLKETSWQALPSSKIKTKDWIASMEKTLKTLYKKLMIHVHRILKEKSPTKEILFIPSQSLAVLPLHGASWKDKNGEIRYLLEEFTISYCPSVSVFKRCQENEKSRTDRTLLITNPTGDLIFSEKETEFIETFHQPSKNLHGKKATKSAVIKALRDDYSFTHFASHGFYHLENQFDSGLVMADQVIKLSEIINCDFQNNWLTTLSACETGMVDFDSPTDEHFGLPLGFIFAGSPSIWASLWSVSDETTSLLMQKAYENLSKCKFYNNKPEALRQAQLSIKKKFSHPYYWAGFQHYGI
jgi:CHAT domain-containing protein/Tfp pilus assembly protein PilF